MPKVQNLEATYKPYRCFLVDKKRHNLNMDAN